MEVTIVASKIHHANAPVTLDARLNSYGVALHLVQVRVTMSERQFIRFKCAGRQSAMANAKQITDPLTGGVIATYQRADRTQTSDLGRWDVEHYGKLTGRNAPCGRGAATNRDHLLADSINQIMYSQGANPYGATSASDLKRQGYAVTVSGHHHRRGSETYGGRVQAIKHQHANNPTTGAQSEMAAMMAYKHGPSNRKNNTNKSTLRIEMVGAYCFLYKKLVEVGVMVASPATDLMLLQYLQAAVTVDDGYWRINPQSVGVAPTGAIQTGSGTKWTA
jgi:hypothetical protein